MKRSAVLAVFVVAVDTASAQVVTEMTPARIQQALGEKKGTSCYEIKRGVSGWSWGGPTVGCFTTPYSRVVAERNSREKRYQQLTAAEIAPELVAAGEVHVFAFPLTGRGKPNDVVTVVVGPHKGKGAEGVIQPLRTAQISTEHKNLFGATFEGHGMMAVFPLSVLSEANEFRVVFEAGEEKARIKLTGVK